MNVPTRILAEVFKRGANGLPVATELHLGQDEMRELEEALELHHASRQGSTVFPKIEQTEGVRRWSGKQLIPRPEKSYFELR